MIEEEIVELYTKKFQSIESISNLLNMSKYKVKQALLNKGITNNLKYYIDINQKYLYGQAVEDYLESKSLVKTCGKYGIFSKNNFSNYLKSIGIEVINYNNLISQNENIFEIIDNEEKAYWLGFLYADGYIGKRNKTDTSYRIELALKESDYNHLVKFKKFIGTDNKISLHKNKLGNSYRISVGGKKIAQDLIDKGCLPNKSLILTFPTYDMIPKYLMRHFLRGYFEGDGWLGYSQNKKKHRASIVGTKDFIYGFCEELKIIDDYKNKLVSEGKAFGYEFRTQDCENVLKTLYENCNIYLDRKYKRYKFDI